MMKIVQLNTQQAKVVRSIARDLGGARSRHHKMFYFVGKQCARMDSEKAHALINEVVAAGFYVDCINTCRELADNGMLDSIMVAAYG